MNKIKIPIKNSPGKSSVLKEFLESDEWDKNYYPERIDSEFVLDVIRARYNTKGLADEALEKTLSYIFVNETEELADYLLPEEIRNDPVVSCCISHAEKYLADMPEFEDMLFPS